MWVNCPDVSKLWLWPSFSRVVSPSSICLKKLETSGQFTHIRRRYPRRCPGFFYPPKPSHSRSSYFIMSLICKGGTVEFYIQISKMQAPHPDCLKSCNWNSCTSLSGCWRQQYIHTIQKKKKKLKNLLLAF